MADRFAESLKDNAKNKNRQSRTACGKSVMYMVLLKKRNEVLLATLKGAGDKGEFQIVSKQ